MQAIKHQAVCDKSDAEYAELLAAPLKIKAALSSIDNTTALQIESHFNEWGDAQCDGEAQVRISMSFMKLMFGKFGSKTNTHAK